MKRVIIAGFGDTGVLVAAHLPNQYDVTAISTKPLLLSGQELGSRLTRLESWKENYLMEFGRFKRLDTVKVLHGKVTKIRPEDNCVEIKRAEVKTERLDYDALVIASGTTSGFWRTADVATKSDIESALDDNAQTLKAAAIVAIVGAGPTGVSTASNLKEIYPEKEVHLYYPHDLPLKGYHPKTRQFVENRLKHQGVELHTGHRALFPDHSSTNLQAGTLSFETGQPDQAADCILWATGNIIPNHDFIPSDLLNQQGYVEVSPTFQTLAHDNIFAIGDIAATDPNRSSARNFGAPLAAKNMHKFLSGRPQKMKAFKPPAHRWGSVLGIQNEGMRIFSPKGKSTRIPHPWVKRILFPIFVDRMIYRGIRRK